MKIIILIFFCLIILNTSDYCKGWEEGYKQGWCHNIINCIEPIVPVCPIPEIECNSGYKCGYNRAFQQALKDREK